MIDQLCFHNTEKRFGYGVIPAISLSGHALHKSMLTELFSKIRAGILNATLRMKNKTIGLARTMAYRGVVSATVTLVGKIYQRGVRLTKKQMMPIEKRLRRLKNLEKWFITITPELETG